MGIASLAILFPPISFEDSKFDFDHSGIEMMLVFSWIGAICGALASFVFWWIAVKKKRAI